MIRKGSPTEVDGIHTGVGELSGKEEQFEAVLLHITRVEVIDPSDDG